MGWNSWNYYGCNVSDAIIRGVADAMATNGMKAAGYQFVNIDDCWQTSRDPNGVLVADPVRFPYGIQGLADYVHSKGLKLGIYSDHGTLTCAGRPAAYGHNYVDANTYASWGVDYLKFDNCNLPAGDSTNVDDTAMANALMNSGRSIVFSLCNWQFVSWEPGAGNLWRTTGDINDSFSSMLSNLSGDSPPAFFAGPCRWKDPDMLEVGNGGMTFSEDQAHFSLWCMVAAPLIAGNNMATASAQTLSILTNANLIAVDQDPAGEQGVRLPNTSTNQIWVKPLGTNFNTKAVALFNTNASASSITVYWTNIGLLAGSATVEDLWANASLGASNNSFTTNVPAQTAVVLKVVGTAPPLPATGTNYLSALQAAYAYTGYGTITANKNINGGVITLNSKTYTQGIGVNSFSGVEYRLGAIASRFQSDIGVDDTAGTRGSVVFHVLADGTEVFNSGVMTGGMAHQSINLDVTGVNRLTLGVDDAGDGINYDDADWAGALVVVSNTTPAPPPAPTGLTASPGNPVSIYWDATRSAAGYNIKRSLVSTGPFTNIAASVLPAYYDTNVQSGDTYYYVVSAVSSFGESSNSAPASATACTPPSTPSAMTVVPSSNQIALSWNAVPGATSYSVARALDATPYSIIAAGLGATNYTDTSVILGTNYSYVVFAGNSCSQSGPSPRANATPMLVPVAPTGLTATPGGSSVVLVWNASSQAAGYNLYRSTSGAGSFVVMASNVAVLLYQDTGLSAGTTYYYAVSAVNLAGEGPLSSPAVAASPCTGALPTGWTDQDIGSVGYAGSASSCGSSFIMQGGGADIWNNADAFNFASATLAGDSKIFTQVDALEATDPWAKAGVMYRNDNTAGSMFVDMIISAANGANLQWRATTGGACSFTAVAGVTAPAWVMLGRAGNLFTGWYSSNGTTWTQVGTTTVAMNTAPLAGLAVTAHNNSYLCLAAFDSVSTTAPATPTGLNAAASCSQVTMTWNTMPGAVTYNLNRAGAMAGPYTNLLNLAATSYADTNVANSSNYWYEVSAVNPIGQSLYSSPVGVQLSLPPLSAQAGGNSLVISWPVTASSFALYSATSLSAPVAWSAVTNAPSTTNGVRATTLPPTNSAVFYRLISP